MSDQQPLESGRAASASNAETVVPSKDGGGAAGTAGGRGPADVPAMEQARDQAAVVEQHSEPGGDDAPPPDVGEPDPNTPAGMPPAAPSDEPPPVEMESSQRDPAGNSTLS